MWCHFPEKKNIEKKVKFVKKNYTKISKVLKKTHKKDQVNKNIEKALKMGQTKRVDKINDEISLQPVSL